MYVWLTGALRAGDQPSPWLTLLRDASPDVVVALFAYLIVNYVLYRHHLASSDAFATSLVGRFVAALGGERAGIKHVFTEPAKIDWGALIEQTDTSIVIVARYWDDQATLHRKALAQFFLRGGRLMLYICDPNEATAVDVAAEQRSADQPPEARQIRWRIYRTITEIEAARRLAGRWRADEKRKLSVKASEVSNSQFELRYLKHAVNFELVRLDGRELILLPQSHFFLPEAQCPALWFDLAWADGVNDFAATELDAFEHKRSNEGDISVAIDEYRALRRDNPSEVPEPPGELEESGQLDVQNATT